MFLRFYFCFFVLLTSHLDADDSLFNPEEIISLEEINIGDEGVWQTVVRGVELSTFPLKVLGIVDNFAGPGQPVIICEALDDLNRESGPVAGMSGSPVYIDGKLAGAYAYGYMWPKNQAIIGVTPIAQMLELLHRFEPHAQRFPKDSTYQEVRAPIPLEILKGDAQQLKNLLKSNKYYSNNQKMTLFSGGISEQTLKMFQEEIDAAGVSIVPQSASGNSSLGEISERQDYLLEPGYPVAGVLMDGDFSFTGVGTVTWRQEDRLLGFGHSYFRRGAADIPMAGARIITTIQSLSKSFKLSSVGKVVGSIYQDRLTAIAGEVGRLVYRIPVTINLDHNGHKKTYSGNLYEDKSMTPLLSSIGMLQVMNSSLEKELEQHYKMTFNINFKDYPEIKFTKYGGSPEAAFKALVQYFQHITKIMNNPFTFPRLNGIQLDLEVSTGLNSHVLHEFRRIGGPVEAGEEVRYEIQTMDSEGDVHSHYLEVPFDLNWQDETLEFLVCDAPYLKTLDQGVIRYDWDSFEDILHYIGQEKPNNKIYVRIMRNQEGLRVQGQELMGLPPSVIEILASPNIAQKGQHTSFESLWEGFIELPTDFQGLHQFKLYVQ